MAKPRVFVSSTFYDLKHIRSSLEVFIDSLGYEAILSEKGGISYDPDLALDESCYRDAAAADLFVLIVGGRYGSGASNQTTPIEDEENFASITRKEFESAHEANVPIYVLIESAVQAEYQTYKKNKGKNISYAHVDSVNVFKFLDSIYSKSKNNPIFGFEKSTEIQDWLKDQWAGLFREMLSNKSQNKNLSQLSIQINNLDAINSTLKNYLELIVEKLEPSQSESLIATEDQKLARAKQESIAKENHWFKYMNHSMHGIEEESAFSSIRKIESFKDIESVFKEFFGKDGQDLYSTLKASTAAQRDFNQLRKDLNLGEIKFPGRKKADL